MTVNESATDRAIRFVLALVLFYFAFQSASPWNWILGLVAVVLLFTAITGFCALYKLLGISTKR
ncbi:MAG: YgaP family membrane protein [Thermus sp.]|uniref:YgaP family membrane protein n=1 Tax=Thermus sp. TaxID=275 RepID=UPI003D09A33A